MRSRPLPDAVLPSAPGPRGLPFFGMLVPFVRDPLAAFRTLAREHGEVVRFNVGPKVGILVSHPDLLRTVLVDKAENYVKGRTLGAFRPLLGEGLLTAEGERWRRSRRTLQPSFHRDALASLVPAMVAAVQETIDGWRRAMHEGPVHLADDLSTLTLSVVARTLFGADLSASSTRVGRALTVALRLIDRRLLSPAPLPLAVPSPSNLQLRSAIRAIDEVVLAMVRARRSASASRGDRAAPLDLLDRLVAARDPVSGAALEERELRDEAVTLLLAGHETTSAGLAWTLYLLAQHPDVQDDVAAEVETVLAGRTPSAQDLAHLAKTTRAVEESLRLYPPIWGVARDPVRADVLGGFTIPAGCSVYMETFLTHRRADLWDAPDAYRPQRFDTGSSSTRPSRHPFAYLPFGAGRHKCIGAAFAVTEMVLALAMFVQAFHFGWLPGAEVHPVPRVTLRPSRVAVALEARDRRRATRGQRSSAPLK